MMGQTYVNGGERVEKRGRIELMDAMRGLAVLLMVVHHFFYDLAAFCGAPWWLFSNPLFDVLHYVFAGLFILLSGVSSNFSRSNVKRGLKALGCAVLITAVTVWMEMDIWFGVLHLLSVCMILYGFTRALWEKLPAWVVPVVSVIGVIATGHMVYGIPTANEWLWMFGWTTESFYSADYFPMLPWVFVFLFGTWAGRHIKAGRLPGWFYTARAPRLAAAGRRSLLIYVFHQPVLYGITMGIAALLGR